MIVLVTILGCIIAVAITCAIRRASERRTRARGEWGFLIHGKPGIGKTWMVPPEPEVEWFSVSEFERGWRTLLPTRISNVLLLINPKPTYWCGTAPSPVLMVVGGYPLFGPPVYAAGTKVPPKIIVVGGQAVEVA